MIIEIADQVATKILEGLRTGDASAIAHVADLLQPRVNGLNKYPYEVFISGTHYGYFSAHSVILAEFDGRDPRHVTAIIDRRTGESLPLPSTMRIEEYARNNRANEC